MKPSVKHLFNVRKSVYRSDYRKISAFEKSLFSRFLPKKCTFEHSYLVGTQDYWPIIGKSQIRSPSRPVPLSFKLGYILNGSIFVLSKTQVSCNNLVGTHFYELKLKCKMKNCLADKNLN